MVELEVSSADKQGKDFTQVQGPHVEVTPLRPACQLLLCEYDGYKGPGEMSISLGFRWFWKYVSCIGGPPSLYIIGWVSGVRNRPGLHVRKV